MPYRSIVLCGPVASGTTTAAKTLSETLNIPYRSAGDFFRDYMTKHNIPLPQKEKIPDEIERKIDDELTQLAASDEGIILDGLYTGYFTRDMPHVLRVLLTADEQTRIKRATERTHTHKESADDVRQRDKAHDLKFRKLYEDENFLDPKFFDLIIDTSNIAQEETVKRILEKFENS